METIINIKFPLKRVPASRAPGNFLPRRERWFGWLVSFSGGAVHEFGGSRVNKTRHISILRWHVLTIQRNQYHDRSDAERADEYLRRWSACDRELTRFRNAALGESLAPEIKALLRESLGLDLDKED